MRIKLTFKVNDSLVCSFDDDGLVGGLVALEPVRAGRLVADESLIAFQDQNWKRINL